MNMDQWKFYKETCIDYIRCFPFYSRMANFEKFDFTGSGMNQAMRESGLNEYASSLFDPSLTWDDLEWLKSITSLPVVLKGILSGKQDEFYRIT